MTPKNTESRHLRRLKAPFLATALIAAPLVASNHAHGTLIIDFQEVGGDVVATANGSVNTTGLTSLGDTFTTGLVSPAAEMIFVGPMGFNVTGYFTEISGPSSFGDGGETFASSGTGDMVGFTSNTGIYVPTGYVSGTPLSSTATWTGQSFASLGLTPGTYTATWGSGPDADSLTLNIGSVPESGATFALMVLGLGGLLAARRKSGRGVTTIK